MESILTLARQHLNKCKQATWALKMITFPLPPVCEVQIKGMQVEEIKLETLQSKHLEKKGN